MLFLRLRSRLNHRESKLLTCSIDGWALRNRNRLMPTPVQVERSLRQITEAQSVLKGGESKFRQSFRITMLVIPKHALVGGVAR